MWRSLLLIMYSIKNVMSRLLRVAVNLSPRLRAAIQCLLGDDMDLLVISTLHAGFPASLIGVAFLYANGEIGEIIFSGRILRLADI